jgi:nicotinate-nucleotide adenylyltransferase
VVTWSVKTMRLGVFGGTFNPVHLGHLILAEQCREQGRLDQVLFVPAPRPPHKQDTELASYAQRVEMLALATSGQPAFRVDELEKDRPGPSFTVDTLQQLRERHREAEMFLIIGSDTLRDLPQWYQPVRILELAGLLVVPRPGWSILGEAEVKKTLALPDSFSLCCQTCEIPLIDIASRDLRRRIAQGRSVRYMIPRAVEAYIQDKNLYTSASDG